MSPIKGDAFADTARLGFPCVAVHGGAGGWAGADAEKTLAVGDALRRALDAAWTVLGGDGPALDAVAEAVVVLEDSGLFNAGAGATPTRDALFELDAAVMDGRSGRFGAVCAARWPANPVQAAQVMVNELGGPRRGAVLLAGAGADKFCEDAGLPRRRGMDDTGHDASPLSDAGTVGAVAIDASGGLAAATSTGGVPGQLTGRVGDSPIPGAGTWADEVVAVSGTGAGEAFMVAGFAHRVAWFASYGGLSWGLAEALSAVEEIGGTGGAVALDREGTFCSVYDTAAMARGWRNGDRTWVALFKEPIVDRPSR